jgi:transglutaminase-like putative cysteine protease
VSTIRHRNTSVALALAVVTLPSLLLASDLQTHRFVLPAATAFEDGQGAHAVMLNDSGAVVLYNRVLIEDDGPGMGSDADWLKTDRAPTTEISGDTRVMKTLHIDRLGAFEAQLIAPPGVRIELNGHDLAPSSNSPTLEIPPSLLKEGDNEVVLSSLGGKGQTIKIAPTEDILRNNPERKNWPQRSFESTNAGKTWEPIHGEYMVRVHLTQYLPHGDVVSPVIELGGGLQNPDPLLTPVSVQSVVLSADADAPAGSQVELAYRAGSSPVYDAATWSDWRDLGSAYPAGSRYLQWKATLSTTDPLKTPLLRSVTVEAKGAKPSAPTWANQLRMGEFHNEEIRYTSMPFEYENPLSPRMVALRQKYKLDDIVAGASSETEKLVRLRDWIAHQWKICAPEDHYPAWDADEILTRKYGFCVQYACTLMQCAISLGYQARFVFGYNPGAFDGGGHEVCEVWSNEHRKWIFYDVNQNWFYFDPKRQEPMSMLEVHDVILKTYYGGQLASLDNPPQRRVRQDDIAVCYGTNMLPSLPPKEFERHFVDGHYTSPTRWLFFNYIPRNNFYEKPYPQPKTQGCDWDWCDYWCWEDAATPKRWLYRNFTARRNDVNWTINQVRFDATLTDKPGAISMQMGTITPYFDTYLVNVDGQGWEESARRFVWQLHPGRNRVEMRIRNTSGVQGPPSFLEVEMF